MSLLKQAEYIILKRKQSAESKALFNYKKALNFPEIKAAERNYSVLLPKLCRCEAFNIEDENLKKQYLIALKQRKEALEKYKISDNDLIPQYYCPKCKDTGYKDGVACICLKQTVNNIITDEYGINTQTFNSFEDNGLDENPVYKQQLADKYEKMLSYCNSFPSTKYSTHIFTGLSGTGKTYLASCVAKKIMERGYSVIFITAFKINEIFLKYHLDFRGEGSAYLDNLYTCNMLVIDDLGTENTFKNVTNEYLLSLLSERFANNRHTLVTTNLDGEQIRQKYDDRLHSRLLDKKRTYIFPFAGDDLRQIK